MILPERAEDSHESLLSSILGILVPHKYTAYVPVYWLTVFCHKQMETALWRFPHSLYDSLVVIHPVYVFICS